MNLLDEARAVLDEGPVCDGCLGRRFAELSHGLTSRERGRALSVSVAMEDDVPYDDTPPDDCWVCDGAFASFGDWADRAVEAVEGYDFDTFLVGTRVPPLVEENERLLDDIHGDEYAASFSSEFNREVGKRFGERVGATVEFERPDVTVTLDVQRDSVEVEVHSVYFYGRYRKLERGIAQTEWGCYDCEGTGVRDGDDCETCGGTGYIVEESVEELLAPAFLEATEGAEAVFHGAGREDVDALMLGDGRPFVMEVEQPRVRDVDTDALQADANDSADGKVEVRELRRVDRDAVERVKSTDASKRYRARVSFDEPVSENGLDDALERLVGRIEQRTPERVERRRADTVREREVYEATGELDDDGQEATVELHTEGGTYVKELVSGDEGRTEPSLAGELGVGATVEALDVLAVEAEEDGFVE
ncbi:MAG: tRNA pseudouridine(54/55) synthase Pus10 [Halobacteriales archaeon]